jgi:uncharacterized small protein (DUF1192 family)
MHKVEELSKSESVLLGEIEQLRAQQDKKSIEFHSQT